MKRRAVPTCPPTPTSHGAEAGAQPRASATQARPGRSGGLRRQCTNEGCGWPGFEPFCRAHRIWLEHLSAEHPVG